MFDVGSLLVPQSNNQTLFKCSDIDLTFDSKQLQLVMKNFML